MRFTRHFGVLRASRSVIRFARADSLESRRLLAGGVVEGLVWHDVDRDKVVDPTEAGLATRAVYVDYDNDKVLDSGEPSAATTTAGTFRIQGVRSGTFPVRQILLPGWQQSYPDGGFGFWTNFSEGSLVTGLRFGSYQSSSATGFAQGVVWNDLDRDGTRDSNEPGISARTVYVDYDNDKLLDSGEPSAVSDSNGNFNVAGVRPGSAPLRQIVPMGWTQTYPSSGFGTWITFMAGVASTGHRFGSYSATVATGTVTGTVWHDINANGIRESFEPLESAGSGQRVWADLDNDGTYDVGEPFTGSVSNGGSFTISNVPAGNRIIRTKLDTGYVQTAPANNAGFNATVPAGGTVSTVQFGWRYDNEPSLGSVQGGAFNDLNGDGVVAGLIEPSLTGVPIYVDYDNDRVRDSNEPFSTVMGPMNGQFFIDNVRLGSYPVRLDLPAGMVQIRPSGGFGSWVTVQQGMTASTGTFLAWTPTTLSTVNGYIWNDSDGDGVWDENEEDPVPVGVIVFNDRDGDGVPDSNEPQATARTDGYYSFRVPAGPVTLRIVVPTGWRKTSPPGNEAVYRYCQPGWTETVRAFGIQRIV